MLKDSIYPWQHNDWQRLHASHARWPHALLFYGQAGIGKVRFARAVAQALLCESPVNAEGDSEQPFKLPCGHCIACHWFAQGSHPDYRLVCPESVYLENIGPESGMKDATGDGDQGDQGDKAEDVHRKARTLSQEIKIEQVRALLDFCSASSHRAGWRVVLLHPAEALNQAAANALLKMLEEPPLGIVFLLACTKIDLLLPTIISRCQRWPMYTPTTTDAHKWLVSQGLSDSAAIAAIAYAGGAPLAALNFARNEYANERTNEHAARHRTWYRFIFDQLAAGARCDAFACAETLQKAPKPLVLNWLQRWLYDLAVLSVGAASQPRYYPHAINALMNCVKMLDSIRLMEYARTVNLRRAIEKHPINARLFFEELFLGYRSIYVY